MSKRIYIGLKDPKVAALTAQKTGIDVRRLEQAGLGKVELSQRELSLITKALPDLGSMRGLNVNEARPRP